MSTPQRFAAAMASLIAQRFKRYKPTPRKYLVDDTKLRLTYQGKRGSRAEATSIHPKLLTDTQEEELLELIDRLTIRSLAPTPAILENLVQEIIHTHPGTRWVERFVKRYGNRVKSPYLRTIDAARVIADNSKYYSNWLDQVSIVVRPRLHNNNLFCTSLSVQSKNTQ